LGERKQVRADVKLNSPPIIQPATSSSQPGMSPACLQRHIPC
jgi:hypothetical protein